MDTAGILRTAFAATMIAFAGACESERPNPIALGDDRWGDRPNDETLSVWPLDMRLDVAIERILELRGRAARGEVTAQSQLGPAMDNEESALWRTRQAERECLALSRLAMDGVIAGDGAVRIGREALLRRLQEAQDWTLGPRTSRHFENLSPLGPLAVRRAAARERALVLAEMAILRRLIAASPP